LAWLNESEKAVFEIDEKMKGNCENVVRDMLAPENEFAFFCVKDLDENKIKVS